MREPNACLLQLRPDYRGVRLDILSVDLHFPRRLIAGRTLSNTVLRLRTPLPLRPSYVVEASYRRLGTVGNLLFEAVGRVGCRES
jgi:hypothetical protein